MTTATIDLTKHPAGTTGFSPGLIRVELRRMLRNKRVMIFTLVFPILMLLLVSSSIAPGEESMGQGIVANVGAYIMVSMALYGVSMAATSGGAAVSVERASGWSRQMRLTPLNPTAYVLLKVAMAFLLGSLALLATYGAGELLGLATMTASAWVLSTVIILLGAVVFSAFGLFLGYLIPSENVMQFLGPLLALLGFLGGLFQGPVDTASVMGRVQSFTPIYGLSQVAHWPLTETAAGGYAPFDWWWLVNLVGWGAVFVAGAVWRFRKDTARV